MAPINRGCMCVARKQAPNPTAMWDGQRGRDESHRPRDTGRGTHTCAPGRERHRFLPCELCRSRVWVRLLSARGVQLRQNLVGVSAGRSTTHGAIRKSSGISFASRARKDNTAQLDFLHQTRKRISITGIAYLSRKCMQRKKDTQAFYQNRTGTPEL